MEWTAPRLRRHLLEELLPYWAERGADRAHGGFWNRLDGAGLPLAEDHKRLLVQLRLVYAFSEGARLGAPEALGLAAHGVAFVERGYHDARHGGWYLTATPEGEPLDRRKDFYVHAFAVFAYAAYYAASGERSALARAHETVAFVRERLRDPVHGGYFEEADETGVPLRDLPRRQNPHMHWLEALLALHAVAPDAALRDDARALVDLLERRFLDRRTGGLMEHFSPSWEVTDPTVEPGHHYEWTWLLLAHRELLGPARVDDIALRLFGYAESFGVDTDLGVFDAVAGSSQPKVATKRLWPQTERVKALAARDDVKRLRAALHALFARYARKDGGWIEHVDRGGTPTTDVQNATSVYHVTLALREAAAALGEP
jgi:mannose/cellobiose epimerase-like protein (N-acyl-D-glucosamine 2-epimerase family)